MAAEQDFYREFLDRLFDGVYLVDTHRVITFWNKSAERISGYTSKEVVGRACADNVLIHVDKEGANLCLSSCPLAQCINEGGGCEGKIFLHHKNGERVPVTVRTSPLRDANGVIIGGAEVFQDTRVPPAALEELEEWKKKALLDPLTELPNRRYGEVRISSLLGETKATGMPFGLLFLDVDHFKNVNDTHGHEAGDKVLQMVSKTVGGSLRSRDQAVRWGGEEFVVILHVENHRQLSSAAEKIRMLVENSVIFNGRNDLRVTVSIGATLVQGADMVEQAVKRADMAMYQSKTSGRNRVTVLM
jgi:diguanylate cyclase (GGDEF)-like protein/PAS domain S-box-containing protein